MKREVNMANREYRKAVPFGTKSIVLFIPPEFLKALKIEPKGYLRLDLDGDKFTVRNAMTESEMETAGR